MAPVKFDDLSRVAADVLNEDYQVKGYVLKTKQRAHGGAVLSGQFDLFADEKCSTPAKLSWKMPSPFGVSQVNVDKLEMDRNGKFKLEASSDKICPVVKVEVKSDLADLGKVMVGCSYTGLKNLQVKTEHKLTNPLNFTGEMTYQCPAVTCGMKFSSAILTGGLPDVGLRFQRGQVFGSLLAKEKLSALVAHGFYDLNPDVKCAASLQYGGKGSGNFTLGVAYKGVYKVKVSQDQSICCSHKHQVAKGFTLLSGAKYGLAKGDFSCGMQLSIE